MKRTTEKINYTFFEGSNGVLAFGACIEEWLAFKRDKVKESTYAKYYNIVYKHIYPMFGDSLVVELNQRIIEGFLTEKLECLSPKSVKDIYVVLKSVLHYIEATGLSLSFRLQSIKIKEKPSAVNALNIKEQKKLEELMLSDMDTYKLGALLSLYTGIRIGELCALKWSEISLEHETIEIISTLQRIQTFESESPAKTKIIITSPKSDSSTRKIPIPVVLSPLLQPFKQSKSENYFLTGTPHYIEPRSYERKFQKLLADNHFPKIHFHMLRHTFATRCVEADFEIKCLSEILGHSSVSITLDRYVHASIETKRLQMNKLQLQ